MAAREIQLFVFEWRILKYLKRLSLMKSGSPLKIIKIDKYLAIHEIWRRYAWIGGHASGEKPKNGMHKNNISWRNDRGYHVVINMLECHVPVHHSVLDYVAGEHAIKKYIAENFLIAIFACGEIRPTDDVLSSFVRAFSIKNALKNYGSGFRFVIIT